jgi:hypothetical protein
MEKFLTCVGCSADFQVLSSPDAPPHRQHEVEISVECPFCSMTNAMAWPQDESRPLVIPISHRILECQKQNRIHILHVAKELVEGRIGVIAAARELRQFYGEEAQLADLLLTFVGIDSETDDLPVGGVRKEWSRDALERKDREIAAAEQLYRDRAMNAAAALVRLLASPSEQELIP